MLETPPAVSGHMIDMPVPIDRLVLFYRSRLTAPEEGRMQFEDGSFIEVNEVAEEYGLNPEDNRTQDIMKAVRLVADDLGSEEGPLCRALNTAILYRSTNLYTEDEMTVLIGKQIHPLMFELVDEWVAKGEDFTPAFSKVLDDSRALVVLADFLVKYTEDAELLDSTII